MESRKKTTKVKNRGVTTQLIKAFKDSPLYKLYKEHEDELIVCIRHNYINIYYRLNSIAEIRLARNGKLSCKINAYFLGGKSDEYQTFIGDDINIKIIDRYDDIKHLVDNKKTITAEKICQEMLFIQNNRSNTTRWYCVDVEWARSFKDEDEKNSVGLKSRMDIIATSLEAPHRIAIIELKYGYGSLSGDAGVKKHVEDFKIIKEGKVYKDNFVDIYGGLKRDVVNILKAYKELGIYVPDELSDITTDDISDSPDFYILTLDNNAKTARSTTPKQTMAAYLFTKGSKNYLDWNCKRPSQSCVQDSLNIDVLDANSSLCVTFVFSKLKIEDLTIKDILEDESYEVIKPTPKLP